MNKNNYRINGTMDRVIMEMYGLNNEQYYNYNRDLQEYFYDCYYDGLKRNAKNNENKEEKVKVLSLFKKK